MKRTNEQKTFFELYKDEIKEYVDEDLNKEEIIEGIYFSDNNYKHADPTTHKQIYESHEISSFLEAGVNYLKTLDDRCINCAKLIDNGDYNIIAEERPSHFGQPCSENVAIGYTCSKCGHEEDF